jgi:beta-galactosidase/beta-glucuronidase
VQLDICFTFRIIHPKKYLTTYHSVNNTQMSNSLNAPSIPLNEYPRPQMVRNNWTNLNGQWNYAILEKGLLAPSVYEGEITVPYPVESAQSGVKRNVGKDKELWYSRTFAVAEAASGTRTLLHFGAVDWETEVFVNDKFAGMHQGGFDPFYFDITDLLVEGKEQELVVRVWDPTDQGPQPRGKQVNEPSGIWYSPVTGIWQTVWLEQVPASHISQVRITPDLDSSSFVLALNIKGAGEGYTWKAVAIDQGLAIAESASSASDEIRLFISDAKSWTPDQPNLYEFTISLFHEGQLVDQVESYGALRKISIGFDIMGNQRMELNGNQLFHYGPLDQGWWPEGLFTAPSDEALAFDIVKTKEMGFNMIRKHVKIEPARWYYHCDRLGIMVWQDMPSGDTGNRWEQKPGIIGKGTERLRTPESEFIFKKEWKSIMDALYNFPCIVVWIPFNEAWGQFKTKEISQWTKLYDPSRLVNGASGGNFEMEGTKIAGEIFDIHNYPDPAMPCPNIFGKIQLLVLGEYGGLGLQIEGHTWQDEGNWGYQNVRSEEELLSRYETLISDLKELVPKGLAAAVYTQTTDVEIEINGLMTYDRKKVKIPEEALKKLHLDLYATKF